MWAWLERSSTFYNQINKILTPAHSRLAFLVIKDEDIGSDSI